MTSRVALLISAFALSVSAVAETAIPIFGVPLGGHLSKSISVCKTSNIGDGKTQCFVDKLASFKDGTRSGTLQASETSLPVWAAYSSIKVSLAKNGSVASLAISQDRANLADVIDSISARFGQPTHSVGLNTKIPIIEWDRPDVFISVTQWGDRCCEVGFWTPAAIAAQRKYVESMTVRRPKAP